MNAEPLPAYQATELEDLFAARDRFLSRGELVPGVRPVVAESWRRARAYELEPGRLQIQEADAQTLALARTQSRALFEHGAPLLEEMGSLLQPAPYLLALANPRGRILHLITSGIPDSAFQSANLFTGASWHERDIGCNGVGTALAVGGPVVLIGPEHFQETYVGWTCIGVPVRNAEKEIVGVIDLSVPNETVDVRTWGWVLSVVRVLELQLVSSGQVLPDKTELSASFSDPLNTVRGVLDFLGTQLSALPSHQRLVQEGLRQLGAVETRINEMVAQAAELQGRQGDVEHATTQKIAELAHEVRNPIGALGSAIKLLERTTTAQPPVERTLGVMRRQLAVLSRLASDLDTAQRPRPPVEPTRLDLRRIVEDSSTSASPEIVRRGHQLRVSVPEVPLCLIGDPVRLQQALVNLLLNAAKYTDPAGRIEIACTQKGDEIVVSVSDSGRGISPGQLARIFDPFSRADHGHEQIEGRGLGLALVQEIVESHGGRVAARSGGRGQGSVFTLWLPACPREPAALPFEGQPAERATG